MTDDALAGRCPPLRDWFAGQAVAGLMSNCDETGSCAWFADTAAKYAYEIADAMLVARTPTDTGATS